MKNEGSPSIGAVVEEINSGVDQSEPSESARGLIDFVKHAEPVVLKPQVELTAADAYPTAADMDLSEVPADQVQTYMPEKTDQVEILRKKIDEYLAGMAAVRDGLFNLYFIELEPDKGIKVTPENVDKLEEELRNHFAEEYPDLITQGEDSQ